MTVVSRSRRVVVTAILSVALVAVGAVAFASWRATGTGTGTATAGTALAVSLSPGVPTGALFPGGTTSVALTVTNPNGFPVRLGSFARDAARGTDGFAVDATHSACPVTTLSFTTQAPAGGWTIPAKVGTTSGSLPVQLAGSLSMGIGAASACQGASFTVYLVAGA